MFTLSEVERCTEKLRTMLFMHNFEELLSTLKPQVETVSRATQAIKKSDRLKKLLELILGFISQH